MVWWISAAPAGEGAHRVVEHGCSSWCSGISCCVSSNPLPLSLDPLPHRWPRVQLSRARIPGSSRVLFPPFERVQALAERGVSRVIHGQQVSTTGSAFHHQCRSHTEQVKTPGGLRGSNRSCSSSRLSLSAVMRCTSCAMHVRIVRDNGHHLPGSPLTTQTSGSPVGDSAAVLY